MSGSPQAFNAMIANMCHGGKIALLGILPPQTIIDWGTVIFNSIKIKGIYGREMYETWYKMQAMIQSGLNVSPILTHRFPYQEFREGFEIMKSGNSGKIILEWL
jgi:threonine 3-dehydrogenase